MHDKQELPFQTTLSSSEHSLIMLIWGTKNETLYTSPRFYSAMLQTVITLRGETTPPFSLIFSPSQTEQQQVRNHLVPIAPTIERLGRSRHQSSRAAAARGGRGGAGMNSPPPLSGHRPRPQTHAAASRRHGKDSVAFVDDSSPPPSQRGQPPPARAQAEGVGEGGSPWPQQKRDRKSRPGARTAGPHLSADRGGCRLGKRHPVAAGTGDTWPGILRQFVPSGAEAVAGLPLSGEERDQFTAKAAAVVAASHSRSSEEVIDDRRRVPRRALERGFPTPQNQRDLDEGVLPGASTTGGPTVREKKRNQPNATGALPPPVTSAAVARAGGPELSAPQQQELQQWGGFGPGHVPRYFRGLFGVAGEKKMLFRRQSGDIVDDDSVRELIAT